MITNLLGVCTEPAMTIENIKKKANIIVPLIIIVIAAIIGPLINLLDGTLETLIIDQLQVSGQVWMLQLLKLGK